MKLSDLYDADQRTKLAPVRRAAGENTIPHPLNNVQYADGISPCRHAKRHRSGQVCNQQVIGPRGPVDRDAPVDPRPVSDVDAMGARILRRVWRQNADLSPVAHVPAEHASHLTEVDAILANALHDAWLRMHIARLDDEHHARPIPAFQRANAGKHMLEGVWLSLGLSGRIFDEPVTAG